MTPPEPSPATAAAQPDVSRLMGAAHELVSGTLRGRTGFGAFRHFENVFRDSLHVVLESSFLVRSNDNGWLPLMAYDPEMWHFTGRRMRSNPRLFIESVLTAPASYNPQPIWALFWALAKA